LQVTLEFNDNLDQSVQAEAARCGVTPTRVVEDALRECLGQHCDRGADRADSQRQAEIEERNRLMEALLRRTAHFRIGPKPTREETTAR
jgi:hypothetical protein